LIITKRFPGAAQHGAKRNDALQTRDRNELGVCDDPGSAAHRFTLRRIRETRVWVAGKGLVDSFRPAQDSDNPSHT